MFIHLINPNFGAKTLIHSSQYTSEQMFFIAREYFFLLRQTYINKTNSQVDRRYGAIETSKNCRGPLNHLFTRNSVTECQLTNDAFFSAQDGIKIAPREHSDFVFSAMNDLHLCDPEEVNLPPTKNALTSIIGKCLAITYINSESHYK